MPHYRTRRVGPYQPCALLEVPGSPAGSAVPHADEISALAANRVNYRTVAFVTPGRPFQVPCAPSYDRQPRSAIRESWLRHPDALAGVPASGMTLDEYAAVSTGAPVVDGPLPDRQRISRCGIRPYRRVSAAVMRSAAPVPVVVSGTLLPLPTMASALGVPDACLVTAPVCRRLDAYVAGFRLIAEHYPLRGVGNAPAWRSTSTCTPPTRSRG